MEGWPLGTSAIRIIAIQSFAISSVGAQKELTTKLRKNIDAYRGVDLIKESRMTLAEWLDRWLAQIASILRPSTLHHYRRAL